MSGKYSKKTYSLARFSHMDLEMQIRKNITEEDDFSDVFRSLGIYKVLVYSFIP